jgi:hypothetical protein
MVRRGRSQYPSRVNRRHALNLLRDPCFALLLTAAFLARAMIPTGFMPAPQGLVMCSAIVAGDPGAPPVIALRSLPLPSPDAGSDPHDSCPFALALGALADTTATPTLETAWRVDERAPNFESPAPTIPGPSRTQLPRGPPAQA